MKKTILLQATIPREHRENVNAGPPLKLGCKITGPVMAFVQVLLMKDDELGQLMKRQFFSHFKIDEALRPKARGKEPDRAFNYALHSLHEWAKTHKSRDSRLSGPYAEICDRSGDLALYYPAEVTCYVAGELFGVTTPIDQDNEDESLSKKCRDFIRRHPCHFERHQLPQLILWGEGLARRFLKRK